MFFIIRARTGLAAAILAVCCLPTAAAPAGATKVVPEQYLPDHTSFVVIVNVKHAATSELYTRNFKKRLEALLGGDHVPPLAKTIVTTLLRDADRVTFAMGRSSFDKPSNSDPTGIIIVEGRLGDLEGVFKKAAEDTPEVVTAKKVRDATLYEFSKSFDDAYRFMVLTDRNTLVIVPRKNLAFEVLEQAAAGKKTEQKSAAMQEMLQHMKPGICIQFAAAEDMVFAAETGAWKSEESKFHTLGKHGITALEGSITVGADLRGSAKLVAKDAETATKYREVYLAGLKLAQDTVKKQEELGDKDFVAARKALEKIKIGGKDKTITFEARLDAEGIEGLILATFKPVRGPGPKPARPVPIDKDKGSSP